MPNILNDEAEPEPEACWRTDPHDAHDWASQVDREGDDWYIMFRCPGVAGTPSAAEDRQRQGD